MSNLFTVLLIRGLLVLLCCLTFSARAAEPVWISPAPEAGAPPQLHLYLFWSDTCPHCLKARPRLQTLAAEHRWIVLHDLPLGAHPDNVERYVQMAAALGEEARAVPALFYCGRMEVGWDEAPAHVAGLLARLEACRDAAPGSALPAEAPVLPRLAGIELQSLSLPLITLLIAGMDAFNPCAFFVLLFLLSLLVRQPSRGRMLLIGLVFVGISGAMYFAFMAAWLGVFQIVGHLRGITAAAGVVAVLVGLINIKDFFAFKRGLSLSISEAGRAGIFQRARNVLRAESLPAMLAATVLLAVAANFYELLCTAGLPMVYTRILTLQVPDLALQYAYLAFYNLIYVLPLLAIVLVFVRTMGARKLSEHEGRLLKLLSGLMMAGLGLILLLAPARLDDPLLALGLIAGAILVTVLAGKWTRQC